MCIVCITVLYIEYSKRKREASSSVYWNSCGVCAQHIRFMETTNDFYDCMGDIKFSRQYEKVKSQYIKYECLLFLELERKHVLHACVRVCVCLYSFDGISLCDLYIKKS